MRFTRITLLHVWDQPLRRASALMCQFWSLCLAGGAQRLADIKRSDFDSLSLDYLRQRVNEYVEIPLVSQLLAKTKCFTAVSKLFMRQEYCKLLDAWLQDLPWMGTILVGSPGIGKSYCSYVALEYKLRDPSCAVVIWLWDNQLNIEGYVQWNETFFRVKSYTDLVESFNFDEAPGGKVTVVYDGRANMHYIGFHFAYTLVVHSPSANIGGSQKNHPQLWYMEPWARDEMEKWAEWHGYDRELARKLYDIAGGAIRVHVDSIARAAKQRKIDAGDEGESQGEQSDPCEQARKIISDAVKSIFYGRTESTALSGPAQDIHRILHWYPEAGNHTQHEIFFCSHYARQMYLNVKEETRQMSMLHDPTDKLTFEAAVFGYIEARQECSFGVRELEGSLQSEGHASFARKTLRWRNLVKYQGAIELVRDFVHTHVWCAVH